MKAGHRGVWASVVALAVAASIVAGWSPRFAAADSVPYTDPAANGIIGLCNQSGQPITTGSVNDKPFVWAALSSVAAQAPYNGDGRTATLYAYQPRPGVPPGLWSGFQMTAASRYTNPSHPMAQATQRDFTISDLMAAFPPLLDGFYQLRLILGAAGQPAFRLGYPATDIKVSGGTWTVIRGGNVACNASTATSAEALLPPGSYTSPDAPTPSSTGAHVGSSSPAAATSGTAGPKPASGLSSGPTGAGGANDSSSALPGSRAAGASNNSASSNGGNAGATIAVGVAALGLIGAAILIWRRRRQANGAS